jgi:hypothetical protein
MRRKLLRSQGRTEVGVALAYDRQSQHAHLRRQTVVARLAAAFGQQARRAVVLEATQQAEDLTTLHADQRAGVRCTQST